MINFIKVVTLIIAVSNGSFVLGNIGTGDKDLSDSNSIFDGMEEGGHGVYGGGNHVGWHGGGRYVEQCCTVCTVWRTTCPLGGGWGTSGQSQEQEQAMMNDGGEQHGGGFGGRGGYGGAYMQQCHAKCMNWKTMCSKVRRPSPPFHTGQMQEQVMNMDEVKPREPGQSPTYYYSEDGNM